VTGTQAASALQFSRDHNLLPDYLLGALAREHLYKPVTGTVLLSGRSTIGPSSAAVRDWFDSADVSVIDYSQYVSGRATHDSADDIPDRLDASVDFILASGSLDDTFDPAMTVKNYGDLLRPGGRLLMTSPFTGNSHFYVTPNLLWYLDYFVMNNFSDCKVYIIVQLTPDWINVFYLDPEQLLATPGAARNFTAPFPMQIVVIAEKADNSTTSIWPTQGQYRSDADWAAYRQSLSAMAHSARPHIMRSTGPLRYFAAAGGHLFVDENHTARDPASEERLERGTPLRPERPSLWQHCKYFILRLVRMSGYDIVKRVTGDTR